MKYPVVSAGLLEVITTEIVELIGQFLSICKLPVQQLERLSVRRLVVINLR